MRETILIWLAWHMPKELVKWAAIRMMATAGATSVVAVEAHVL